MSTKSNNAPLMPQVPEPNQAEFWEEAWQRARRDSFLKASQKTSPQGWHDFYGQVSDIYLSMWGHGGEVGRRVTEALLGEGLAFEGADVLDVGCGPGTLTVPLLQAGARVTALDWNQSMLDSLCGEVGEVRGDALATTCQRWDEYRPFKRHDLVLASFFPDALSPAGLELLEGWSRGQSALVLGTGQESFQFRRELWKKVLDVPFHEGGFHLNCALGWLLATGRRPNLKHIKWRAVMTQPIDNIVRFYTSYFAIFGRQGPEVERGIREALAPWLCGDQVQAEGLVDLALVWWDAPKSDPTA